MGGVSAAGRPRSAVKGETAAFAFIATERPKRTLRHRREQRRAVSSAGKNRTAYFRFAFRFDVRRAAFFAAVLRTVDLVFLLLAIIGMKRTPSAVSGGTIRTPEKRPGI